MPNTADGDLEHALKCNPPWKKVKLALNHALPATASTLLRLAFDQAWSAGFYAGEIAGAKQAREDQELHR
jgi:hypothetical protein